MIISFKIQVSKLQVNSKTGRTKWEMMFYKGPPDSRFSWISGFSCGLDRHFWSISARSSAKANIPLRSGPRKAWGPRFALCFSLLRRDSNCFSMHAITCHKLFCWCADFQRLGGECFAPHLHFACQSEVPQVLNWSLINAAAHRDESCAA